MEVIKPQDLRTGNYINVLGTCEVRAVNADKNKVKVRRKTQSGKYLIEWVPLSSWELKPIPLSEQRLIELGFIESLHLNWWSPCERLNLKVSEGKIIYWELISPDEFIEICELEYVHQLQNLYYSLTGRELTFKE